MLTSEERAEVAALEALQDQVEPLEDFVARVAPQFAPIPWHIQQVFDLFELSRHEEVYATISMPPRHGKTTAIALGLAWRTLYDPACLNFYGTYGDRLSMATSRKIRKLARLAGVPLSKEVANVNEWETLTGGGLKATSMGGDVTGRGCNGGVVVGDDLIKGRKQAESKLIRDTSWDWLRDDYLSRLEPGASFFANMTRWHEDDIIGRLKQDPLGLDWIHIELPAVRGPDGKAADERDVGADVRALWPEGGYDLDRLRKIRMRGENGWWSLYQQRPTPRGGGMFKGKWFNVIEREPPGHRTIRHWDLAASDEKDSAFTAGTKAKMVDGRFVVCDVRDGQWLAHEVEQEIVKTAHVDGKGVEVWIPQDPGQAGKAQKARLAQLLHGFKVHFHIERGKKEQRAEPYAAQAGAGNVDVVRGPWNRRFIDEHEVFPRGRTKDKVDSASGAYTILITKKPEDPPMGGSLGSVRQ